MAVRNQRIAVSAWGTKLPKDWVEEVEEFARSHANALIFDGLMSTSLHRREQKIITQIVGGSLIKEKLPWLFDFYIGPFRQETEIAHNCKLISSPDIESAININIVIQDGGGYEKHFDSNHVTGILFVSDTRTKGSGNLVFHFGDDELSLAIEAGLLLSFTTKELVHSVTNRAIRGTRVTVVMNYYFEEMGYQRPADLNKIMY